MQRMAMILVTCVLAGTPCTVLAADADTVQAVSAANTQFYAALNALFTGDMEPMAQIWSHADDVTYMGPVGGIQVGWEKVRSNWETQAKKRLGGSVKPEKIESQIGRDLAVLICYEVGENVVDGKRQKVRIRATNTFRKLKDSGRWKMVGHHTDLLPFLQQR